MPDVVQINSGDGEQMYINPTATSLPWNTVYKTIMITLGVATAIVASSENSCHGLGKLAGKIKEVVLENPALCAKGLFAASVAPEAYKVVKYFAFENPPAGIALMVGVVGGILGAKFNK